jgi:hypothetical protein
MASAMTWLTARSVSRAPPAFVFVPAPRDVAAVSAARAEAPALRAPPVRDVPVVCARDVDPVRVRAEALVSGRGAVFAGGPSLRVRALAAGITRVGAARAAGITRFGAAAC